MIIQTKQHHEKSRFIGVKGDIGWHNKEAANIIFQTPNKYQNWMVSVNFVTFFDKIWINFRSYVIWNSPISAVGTQYQYLQDIKDGPLLYQRTNILYEFQ